MKVKVDISSKPNASWEFPEDGVNEKNTSKSKVKSDSLEISNIGKVLSKLEDTLNLGKPRDIDLSKLSPKEQEEYLKMLSALLKRGIVGYEILEVNGRKEKHFIETEIGDDRLKGAKRVRE